MRGQNGSHYSHELPRDFFYSNYMVLSLSLCMLGCVCGYTVIIYTVPVIIMVLSLFFPFVCSGVCVCGVPKKKKKHNEKKKKKALKKHSFKFFFFPLLLFFFFTCDCGTRCYIVLVVISFSNSNVGDQIKATSIDRRKLQSILFDNQDPSSESVRLDLPPLHLTPKLRNLLCLFALLKALVEELDPRDRIHPVAAECMK